MLKFPAFLGNEFVINEFLFSYFILLFKPVISGQDITNYYMNWLNGCAFTSQLCDIVYEPWLEVSATNLDTNLK